MNLKLELEKLYKNSINNVPKDILNVLSDAAEKLAKEGIEKQALKVGDSIPSFSLKNAVGETVYSEDLLEQGPLVISFYRGAW